MSDANRNAQLPSVSGVFSSLQTVDDLPQSRSSTAHNLPMGRSARVSLGSRGPKRPSKLQFTAGTRNPLFPYYFKPLESIVFFVGAAGFELATSCSQRIPSTVET